MKSFSTKADGEVQQLVQQQQQQQRPVNPSLDSPTAEYASLADSMETEDTADSSLMVNTSCSPVDSPALILKDRGDGMIEVVHFTFDRYTI
jgi:hypothetical protein